MWRVWCCLRWRLSGPQVRQPVLSGGLTRRVDHQNLTSTPPAPLGINGKQAALSLVGWGSRSRGEPRGLRERQAADLCAVDARQHALLVIVVGCSPLDSARVGLCTGRCPDRWHGGRWRGRDAAQPPRSAGPSCLSGAHQQPAGLERALRSVRNSVGRTAGSLAHHQWVGWRPLSPRRGRLRG